MRPSRRWTLGLWMLAAAALFAAVLLAAVGYGTWAYGRYLDETGISTRARVIDADIAAVSVQFADYRGTWSVAELRWWAPGAPGVGDEVDIVYDPWDPRDAQRAGGNEGSVVAIAATAGAAVMLSVAVGSAAGAVLVHRTRRT